jgi:23S rRNA pseudouridine1911/1915/1917 synthase
MQASPAEFNFIVGEAEEGSRLDRYLAAQFPDLSRTRVQGLVDEGRVLVENTPRKQSYRVVAGDRVHVEIPPVAPPQVVSEAIPLEVLYEDDDVAVVNKPAGMIVHPGASVTAGTLTAALLHRFGGPSHLSDIGGPLRPGIVHRLDKGTSGALLIARNNTAHLRLAEEFRDRQIQKTYLALLHGRVKQDAGRIELPVARDLRNRKRMSARRHEGRPARTDWKVQLRLPGFALVTAGLHTGRTHQLRVHFSALGNPVVGDALYGAPRQPRAGSEILEPLGRNFLHAARIRFLHPCRGQPIEVRAPLPAELVGYLQEIGRATGAEMGMIDAALREFL